MSQMQIIYWETFVPFYFQSKKINPIVFKISHCGFCCSISAAKSATVDLLWILTFPLTSKGKTYDKPAAYPQHKLTNCGFQIHNVGKCLCGFCVDEMCKNLIQFATTVIHCGFFSVQCRNKIPLLLENCQEADIDRSFIPIMSLFIIFSI